MDLQLKLFLLVIQQLVCVLLSTHYMLDAEETQRIINNKKQ